MSRLAVLRRQAQIESSAFLEVTVNIVPVNPTHGRSTLDWESPRRDQLGLNELARLKEHGDLDYPGKPRVSDEDRNELELALSRCVRANPIGAA